MKIVINLNFIKKQLFAFFWTIWFCLPKKKEKPSSAEAFFPASSKQDTY